MSFLPPINGGKAGGEDKEESATAGPTETVENCPHMHVVNEHESSPLLYQKKSLNIIKFFSRALPIRSEKPKREEAL